MPTLQDEIQIVEHFRNTRQQEEADSGFSGRAAFSEFQEGQRKIQKDIAAAMDVMKEAQKPNKLKMFLDFAAEIAYTVDANIGNSGKRRGASRRLQEYRKEILVSRGAKRDRALQNFQTTLATLGKQSDFNVREFNAMLGQLDREQKVQDTELNRRMKQKEFGLSERELNERSFHQAEEERIRRQKDIDTKERNKRLDAETKRYNDAILKIKMMEFERGEVTDKDKDAARAEYSAKQIEIATGIAIKKIGSVDKFSIAGYDSNDKEKRTLLQQYNDVIDSFVYSYLSMMPQNKEDTTGADVVDTIQGGLSKIQTGFSPQLNIQDLSPQGVQPAASTARNIPILSGEELARLGLGYPR